MPHWPPVPWNKNVKYDLENMTKLLKALGNPHLNLPSTIHIAGTNGKGSSVALLSAIFTAANYKVHTYTSPHLVEFNERIVLRGEKIFDDYLYEICERTRQAAESINLEPRFFEGITAAAFLAFSEVKADILILETGLGGRLDATNIIKEPILTLITPISYDHMEHLGYTLLAIAAEKAGIIKPKVPCVISSQVDEVYPVFFDQCQQLLSPAFAYGYDFGITKTANGFTYSSKHHNIDLPPPALLGDHQLINAASVIAAIGLLNQRFNINISQITTGLKTVKWPARIQKIDYLKYANLTGNHISIWLDGAHNSNGAQVLASWAKDNLKEPIYLILGITKNRNIEDFCYHFQHIATAGYAVKVLSEPSSYSAETLAERAGATGINFTAAESLEEAIRQIGTLSNKPANIIICGSLFLAADFLSINFR